MSFDTDLASATAGADLQAQFDAVQKRALTAGAIGLGLSLVGGLIWPSTVLPAYLVAVLFWTGISLGSIGLTFLHHLVGGSWALPLRRPFEAGAFLIVLMAVFFAPILLGLRFIYIWTNPEAIAHNEAIRHKVEVIKFLTPSFFTIRTLAYFAIWIVAALVLNFWSRAQDGRTDDAPSRRLYVVSGPAIVLMFLSATFSAFDWGMSLDPDWYSSIYGAMFIVGELLSTLALMTVIALRLSAFEPMRRAVTPDRLNDVGNLLLAFTMLWAYMTVSQFLIIWLGNIGEEVSWYLRRTQGVWGAVSLALIVFQFFAPFLALLSRETKRKAEWVLPIALWILVMRVVELGWLVLPASSEIGVARFPWGSIPWILTSMVGVGGVWIAAFVWRLRSAPLIPLHDPRIMAALEHSGEVLV
ncbi:MAG: hypothetical protein P4L85_25255 [Paludisphaera borealis]|uniref:hypothetical protein n=1 Tax=Paludisphaera borealis TaxID=1387353 RepID=UPI00284C660E|nr:hypothetical protein [Paludisphaera borealis]MDR3622685.1 hypothetical protein [Paludisphaera borealis]